MSLAREQLSAGHICTVPLPQLSFRIDLASQEYAVSDSPCIRIDVEVAESRRRHVNWTVEPCTGRIPEVIRTRLWPHRCPGPTALRSH